MPHSPTLNYKRTYIISRRLFSYNFLRYINKISNQHRTKITLVAFNETTKDNFQTNYAHELYTTQMHIARKINYKLIKRTKNRFWNPNSQEMRYYILNRNKFYTSLPTEEKYQTTPTHWKYSHIPKLTKSRDNTSQKSKMLLGNLLKCIQWNPVPLPSSK